MHIVLDTSSLFRFFTKDEPEKAIKVKLLLEQEENLYIPDVVFPELEYILSGEYRLSRENLLEIFKFLSSQKNITVSSYIKEAISIFGQTKLDMADCIIASYSHEGKLASFDKKLLETQGIKAFWK